MTDRPLLRIVRGAPTADELAALAALVASTGSDEPPAATAPVRGGWSDPARRVRRYWPIGPGGWRAAH